VSLTGANVQTDVSCPDGTSYTLRTPLPDQSFSIPANSDTWLPSPNQKSPLVYQGSATAGTCRGSAKTSYFSALGENNGIGNPPKAPGFSSTDTTDPLNVRFHCSDSTTGDGGSWSPTFTANY